jgi:hypothetical protein
MTTAYTRREVLPLAERRAARAAKLAAADPATMARLEAERAEKAARAKEAGAKLLADAEAAVAMREMRLVEMMGGLTFPDGTTVADLPEYRRYMLMKGSK